MEHQVAITLEQMMDPGLAYYQAELAEQFDPDIVPNLLFCLQYTNPDFLLTASLVEEA